MQIRSEFWDGGQTLRDGWQRLWGSTLDEIEARQQYIAALYHLDEPFLDEAHGGSNVHLEAFQEAVTAVKAGLAARSITHIKQMATFSGVELNDSARFAKVSAVQDLDYVAFDSYVPINELTTS